MSTTVIHIRDAKGAVDEVNIGRQPGNGIRHYGNPFSWLFSGTAVVKVTNREESIQAFDDWINGRAYHHVEPERRLWILQNLEYLRDKKLVCYCAPLGCHGHIYMRLLNEAAPAH